MRHVIFFEKPGCAANARQKAALSAAGHRVEARNLLAHPWSGEELLRFFAALPVAQWFNRSAPKVKSGEVVPEAMDAATALSLMCRDRLLIRRPLMQVGHERMVGFDSTAVDQWIGLAPGGAVEEACLKERRASPCPVEDEG
jgi:nitrogenase-associated protein